MDMSDLDLVAEATANERAGPSSPKSQVRPDPPPNGNSAEEDNDGAAERALRDLGDLELEDVDLSSLSAQDLATLQPLIDALRISDPSRLPPGFGQEDYDGEANGGDRTGADGEENCEGEPGDVEIGRLLAQMNAAELVADDLDDKLDKLLANLGKVEAEMEQEKPAPAAGDDGVKEVGKDGGDTK